MDAKIVEGTATAANKPPQAGAVANQVFISNLSCDTSLMAECQNEGLDIATAQKLFAIIKRRTAPAQAEQTAPPIITKHQHQLTAGKNWQPFIASEWNDGTYIGPDHAATSAEAAAATAEETQTVAGTANPEVAEPTAGSSDTPLVVNPTNNTAHDDDEDMEEDENPKRPKRAINIDQVTPQPNDASVAAARNRFNSNEKNKA